MRGWSFSVGKVFGVELRLHWFFLLVLVLAVAWSVALGRSFGRGVMLWAMLLAAVGVREIARALAAAWFSLDLRSVLLLPTGGLQTYGTTESLSRSAEARVQRTMALVGPVTSLGLAAVLAGIILAVSPTVNLLETRWVTPEHLLRTLVWLNVLLGAVNLLPAWPLDGGRVLRGEMARSGAPDADVRTGEDLERERRARTRDAVAGQRLGSLKLNSLGIGAMSRNSLSRGLGPSIAVGLVVYGLLTSNWWSAVLGLGIFMAAQVEGQGLMLRGDLSQVLVRDVMLTDYSVLSASATLEDALEQARHSLEDVFPVVRGGSMVGAISRHAILEALEAGGNSYVQGVMTRTFPTVSATEPLVRALERVTGFRANPAQLVPVLESAPAESADAAQEGAGSERMVGLLTPQSLQRSMSIVSMPAAPGRPDGRADGISGRDSERD